MLIKSPGMCGVSSLLRPSPPPSRPAPTGTASRLLGRLHTAQRPRPPPSRGGPPAPRRHPSGCSAVSTARCRDAYNALGVGTDVTRESRGDQAQTSVTRPALSLCGAAGEPCVPSRPPTFHCGGGVGAQQTDPGGSDSVAKDKASRLPLKGLLETAAEQRGRSDVGTPPPLVGSTARNTGGSHEGAARASCAAAWNLHGHLGTPVLAAWPSGQYQRPQGDGSSRFRGAVRPGLAKSTALCPTHCRVFRAAHAPGCVFVL